MFLHFCVDTIYSPVLGTHRVNLKILTLPPSIDYKVILISCLHCFRYFSNYFKLVYEVYLLQFTYSTHYLVKPGLIGL